MTSILDKYFNTQAMVKPETPEEVELVLTEVRSIQQDILERFIKTQERLRELKKEAFSQAQKGLDK
jgi:hypothetical protein